jgi:hypothetical protein
VSLSDSFFSGILQEVCYCNANYIVTIGVATVERESAALIKKMARNPVNSIEMTYFVGTTTKTIEIVGKLMGLKRYKL